MGFGRGGRNTNVGELAGKVTNPIVANSIPGALSPAHDVNGSATRPLRKAITRPLWEIRYAQSVAIADLAAMAVSLGLHKWWGQSLGYDLRVALGLLLLALTAAALGLTRAWDPPILGQ